MTQNPPTSIDQLLDQLKAAHADSDWQRIAELNELTRDSVQSAMQTDPQSLLALRPKLEELSALYKAMESRCIEHRDAVADQIADISQGRSGAGEYSATSSL